MRGRALPLIAGAVIGAGALVGCGGSSQYPAQAQANFLKSCEVRGSKSACQCALQKLEANVSYDDFKRADAALRTGAKVDPGVREQIVKAIVDCAK